MTVGFSGQSEYTYHKINSSRAFFASREPLPRISIDSAMVVTIADLFVPGLRDSVAHTDTGKCVAQRIQLSAQHHAKCVLF